MFQFVYALSAGETLDAASLRVEEFDAFEASDDIDHGVRVSIRRVERIGNVDADAIVWRPRQEAKFVASALNASTDLPPLLVEPWDACQTVRELWNFAELCTSPKVKLAWSVEFGQQTGQSPAAVVPVLNLRIGMLRVRDAGSVSLEYARRLAGIGFGGYLVVDPPPSEDRLGEALKVVEVIRDLLEPRKPAKPAVKSVAKKS